MSESEATDNRPRRVIPCFERDEYLLEIAKLKQANAELERDLAGCEGSLETLKEGLNSATEVLTIVANMYGINESITRKAKEVLQSIAPELPR